ncbi:hypothetical protein niasHT_011294 [Heterodera trifolii]|uniref:Uncharacterized protein n=1 Tax=Heterodera trifolii TaxID=157864 RepID=A0ABD2LAE5_9BILA
MVTLMEALNSLSMIACFLFDPKCNEAYSDNFELLLESWPDPTIEVLQHLRPYICALNICAPTFAPLLLRPYICAPTFAPQTFAPLHLRPEHLRPYICAPTFAPLHLRPYICAPNICAPTFAP